MIAPLSGDVAVGALIVCGDEMAEDVERTRATPDRSAHADSRRTDEPVAEIVPKTQPLNFSFVFSHLRHG